MAMKLFFKRDFVNPVTPGHERWFSWIKPYIRNRKILDIGCWTGPLETLLENQNCKLTATEINDDVLIYMKKRFPKFRFKKAFIEKSLPFKKEEFDVVLFFMVIEHILKGTEDDALKNINKVMKKGGKLFLTTMNSHFLSNLLDPAYFLTGHRHYSKRHLEFFLKNAGFKIEEFHYNGTFFIAFYAWLLYFFKHILRRREPRGGMVDKLIRFDYRNKGFYEIDIRAVKIKDAEN